jgi:uncharacterized protein
MNKVVHFEIPVDDLKRAKDFYATVFGWGMNDYGGEVTLVTTVDSDENGPKVPGAINGDLYPRTDTNSHPSVVMDVESIDEHLEKITAAGGKVIKGKQEMAGMGYYASFADSEGNVLGLWQTIKKGE